MIVAAGRRWRLRCLRHPRRTFTRSGILRRSAVPAAIAAETAERGEPHRRCGDCRGARLCRRDGGGDVRRQGRRPATAADGQRNRAARAQFRPLDDRGLRRQPIRAAHARLAGWPLARPRHSDAVMATDRRRGRTPGWSWPPSPAGAASLSTPSRRVVVPPAGAALRGRGVRRVGSSSSSKKDKKVAPGWPSA